MQETGPILAALSVSHRIPAHSMRLVAIVFLTLAFLALAETHSFAPTPPPLDPYTSEYEKSPPELGVIPRMWRDEKARDILERGRLKVRIPDGRAEEPEPAGLAGTAGPQNKSRAQEAIAIVPHSGFQGFAFPLGLVVIALMLLRAFGPRLATLLNTYYNPWVAAPNAPAHLSRLLAEDDSFSEFLIAFRATFAPSPKKPADEKASAKEGAASEAAATAATEEVETALREFFQGVSKQLSGLRNLLQEIGRSNNLAHQHAQLETLRRQLQAFKAVSRFPALLTVWQMAAALDGLLKQLIDKAREITPSTLRTVASAVDLIEALAVPGVRPDLATNPPIRLLAVDDDSISRHAISFALKKALDKPDVANDGLAALELAGKQTYDVIFLDVQMPGMDGYELCSRIHETALNRATPVVFVTCQRDFNARAKSTLSGGHDLIGKPFLTFEITVKALTLALRGRLEARGKTTVPSSVPAPVPVAAPAAVLPEAKTPLPAEQPAALPTPLPPALTAPAPKEAVSTPEIRDPAPPSRSKPRKSKHRRQLAQSTSPALPTVKPAADAVPAVAQAASAITQVAPTPPAPAAPAPTAPAPVAAPAPQKAVNPCFAQAVERIALLQSSLLSVGQSDDAQARQQLFADLFVRIHSLLPENSPPEFRPAARVISSMEALLKKLLEKPGSLNPSLLPTLSAALDLVKQLCVPGLKSDLASEPPIRIMVVDDDPISLRALAGSLQIAFEKAEAAQSGEAALALAAEKPFDVIFTDVQMPGMDGFTVCKKIHDARFNRLTPVVFVTGQNDSRSQTQATQCGGSDFIGKPFLAAEITLKALTFALRNRLQKL